MKKIFLSILASLSIVAVSAQEEKFGFSKKSDTTKTNYNSDKIEIPIEGGKLIIEYVQELDTNMKDTTKRKPKAPEFKNFWSGVDFGFNGYVTPGGSTTMTPQNSHFDIDQGKSTYWGFNLHETVIPIYKNRVGLVTGYGIDYNNYRFSGTSSPFATPDSLGDRPQKDYITNRLKTFNATVPLLLAFDFSKPNKKGFKLAAGVVGGVRFFSYTKEKIAVDGDVLKMNTRSDFDLNPFKVNAHARLSYGSFTVFASYALTPMFKNQGTLPELYPFQFGISLGS